MRPKRLEYVLGFRISFLQTIIRMSRVMTLAGGILWLLFSGSSVPSFLNGDPFICSFGSSMLISFCSPYVLVIGLRFSVTKQSEYLVFVLIHKGKGFRKYNVNYRPV